MLSYIQHHARSLIFSASMPAANVAACLAALDIMESEPQRYARLQEIGDKMRVGFRALGFNIGETQEPIIPVIIGDDMLTFQMRKAFFDAGVYTNAVISPAVPPGLQLLRTSYMTTHTDEQLDRVLETFGEIGKRMGVI